MNCTAMCFVNESRQANTITQGFVILLDQGGTQRPLKTDMKCLCFLRNEGSWSTGMEVRLSPYLPSPLDVA